MSTVRWLWQRALLAGRAAGWGVTAHAAPPAAPAAILAYAGRLIAPEALGTELRARPPVLLVHGDQDPVVPFEDMGLAGDALVAAGFETYGHVMQGTGHGIAPDGLGVTLQFLKERLPG